LSRIISGLSPDHASRPTAEQALRIHRGVSGDCGRARRLASPGKFALRLGRSTTLCCAQWQASVEIFESVDQVAAFIDEFEACRLPKSRWTHAAHLVVGAWYLQKLGMARALEMTRHRISRYNESAGTPNSDHEGYHETITRAYLAGIADHMEKRPGLEFVEIIKCLLGSPLASSTWPLQHLITALIMGLSLT
jgi:hypothetical protein